MSESGESPSVPEVQQSSKKLNRRELLIKLAGGIAATPLILGQAERGLMHVFANALTRPEIVDNAIDKLKNRAENQKEYENPQFRPMQIIIQEAIDNYKKGSQKPITYKRSSDYRDINYYSDTIKEISNRTILPKSPKDFIKELKGKLEGEAGYAYLESWNDNQQFEDIFPTGSGLYSRFVQTHPDLFDANGRPKNFGEYFAQIQSEGKSIMQEARSLMSQGREKTGKPVSSSKIVEFFLERNNGELGENLYDTAITLKFMARNDAESGYYSARQDPEKNTKWFSEHILDEFKGPSYHNTPEGESQINLIGKPYHSFNLVSLLKFVPVELIQGATAFEYINYGSGHGSVKAVADLQTLSELRSIEGQLLTYSLDPRIPPEAGNV